MVLLRVLVRTVLPVSLAFLVVARPSFSPDFFQCLICVVV